MKNIIGKILLAAALFLSLSASAQTNARLTVEVLNLDNRWDCGNDAVSCCNCLISFCNEPEPRWRARAGWSGGNFQGWRNWIDHSYTCGVNNAGPSNGGSSTPLGHNGVLLSNQNVGAATTFNVDGETWEEDGDEFCLLCGCFYCGAANWNSVYNPNCLLNVCSLVNVPIDGDDVHFGPGRVANIDFRTAPPCNWRDWGWYYVNGQGYGYRLRSYYEYINPTFSVNLPDSLRVCPDVGVSLSATISSSDGNAVVSAYQWQSSPDNVTWSNIGGATSNTYNFISVNAGTTDLTTYYRLRATSDCGASFADATEVSVSNVTRVIVRPPTDPVCNPPTCNTIFVDPVNGNDANTVNRPNTPFKTLQKALSTISDANTTFVHVKVATGTTAEPAGAILNMKSNVLVEGGYVAGAGGADWKKSSNPSLKTTIGGNYAWAAGNARVAILAGYNAAGTMTCNNWRLQDLTITTSAVGATNQANYGVYVSGASNYEIVRCDITSNLSGTTGAGSYAVHNVSTGTGNSILDCKLTASAGGGGVTYACGWNGLGTAPTLAFPNTGGAVTINVTAASGGNVNNPATTELLSGSPRTNTPGKYCINSEIDLTKASGSWGAFPQTTSGNTLNIIEDLKTGSSSYTTASSPIKVYASAAGAYNITVASGTMSKFLTVDPLLTRTLPVISASPSSVCVGATSVNLSVTSGSYGTATEIREREWLVYTDAQGPGSPAYSVVSPTASSAVIGPFNTPGTYNVRYRERHECCGWSKPVFDTITVVADPTAPTLTRDPITTDVCAGTQVRSSITMPTDGVNCANAMEYSIDNGAWLPYTSNTYVGASALASIRIRATRDCSTGDGCTPFLLGEEVWNVTAQPQIFFQPQPLTVCNGALALFNVNVIGGINMNYVWDSSAVGCGSGWSFMTDSTSVIIPSTANDGSFYYRVTISPFDATTGCATLISNCATLTVVPHPTSGPVTPNPNIDTICTTASVTASFGGGANGVACSDIQEFSTDGGATWSSYAGSIPATGLSSIQVRNYRGNCDTIASCTSATANTYSWVVIPPPASGTLAKSPDVTNVCPGATVGVTLATPGTSGKGCTDIIQYRSRIGGVWGPWTNGTSVLTTAFMSDVEFQTYRGNCNPLSGCTDATPNVVSYVVSPQPTLSNPTVSNSGLLCSGAGSVSLSSTVTGGSSNNTPRWEYYNGSTWVKVANGTPAGATYSDTTGTISVSLTNPGSYQYRYHLPVNSLFCGPATSDTCLIIVPNPFSPGVLNTRRDSICSTGTFSNIGSMNTAPSGSAGGSYFYRWYRISGAVTCPTAGTDSLTLVTNGWAPVATGLTYTPPSTVGTFTYVLAVDPTPTSGPDCFGPSTANNCATMQTYAPLNKGTLTGVDSICGATGDPAPFGFRITAGCVSPTGGAGTYQYKWYYYNTVTTNIAPTAGGTSTTGWTEMIGFTGDTLNIPAGHASINTLTNGQGRSYAVMVNATGTPDCDNPTNFQWATGNFYVKITTIVGPGAIGQTPVNLCNANPTLVNQVSPATGPTGSTYSYRWWYRTSTPAGNLGLGSTTAINFAGQAWTQFSPNSNSPTFTPPNNVWGTGDTLIVLRQDTIRTQCSGTANVRYSNWVKFIRNSDNAPITALSTINASQTKSVTVNKWYNFWNANCQLIASVNPNGENLGNVTMEVNVDSTKYTFPNGGYGRDQSCLNKNELAMGRYYKMTTQNTPSAGTTLVRLYYNTNDYDAYASAIAALPYVSGYQVCYGYPVSYGDLAVSRNTISDVAISQTTSLPTSPVIWYSEFALTPSQLRIGGPEDVQAGPTTYHFHTNGGIGGPLPVELVSFVGWNDGEFNQLKWVTASEQNSARYVVEKSANASNNWVAIGEVTAAGNSTSERSYTFTDINPVIGNNYYRLRVVDIDGSFEYSNVINIPLTTATRNAFLGIYPNPTDGLLNIELQSTDAFNSYLKVFDVLGQEVASTPVSIVKGLNQFQMNYKDLAKASYILSYRDNNGVQYQVKFVKD